MAALFKSYFAEILSVIGKTFQILVENDTLLPVSCTDDRQKSKDVNLDTSNFNTIGRPADLHKFLHDATQVISYIALDNTV
jgi:hypothetical protein